MMEPIQLRLQKTINSSLVVVPVICLIIAAILFQYNHPAFYPFLFGFLFGYVMQRSRFCFAASFRDIFLLRSTALTRALILALALSSTGFLAVQWLLGYDLSVMGRVYPVGVHTLVGGLFFGFGMVIAGACVSGCLVKMGEGYMMQYATFAGLIAGSLLGAWNLNWWIQRSVSMSPTVFLPHTLGWPLAIIIQFVLLALLFFWAMKIEGSNNPWSIFNASGSIMPYGIGAVLLSVSNVALFIVWHRPWGVTSGIAHGAGWLAWRVGIPVREWVYFNSELLAENSPASTLLTHPLLYLVFAMVAGSLFASLIHRELRLRRPRTKKYYVAGLVGGLMMGYGSRLAFGCNIGALLSGISSFSLHGWGFALAALFGAAAGGRALLRYLVD
jgi:uncharacterized membrane protein YedE/YeeE